MNLTTLLSYLLLALGQVESNGNPLAERFDQAGNLTEVGIYQITKACVDDVNRIHAEAKDPRRYKWPHDCYRADLSREIAITYLTHYAASVKRHANRDADLQDLARIWSGGPDGYRQAETRAYWGLVSRYIWYSNFPSRANGRDWRLHWRSLPLPEGFESTVR